MTSRNGGSGTAAADPPPPPPRGGGGGGGDASPPFRHVVTAFIQHGDAVALVTRSAKVGTYAGSVGAVSGYLERGDGFRPLARALAEAREEVGLAPPSLSLVASGRPLTVDDGPGRRFVVHPLRFAVADGSAPPPRLVTNWESSSAAWVPAADLVAGRLPAPPVPRLADAYARTAALPPAVVDGVAALTADRTHGAAQLAGWALAALAAGARARDKAGVACDAAAAADLSWPLAAARPAMGAPIVAALAAALLRARADGGWAAVAAAAEAEAAAAAGRAAALAQTAGAALAAAVRAAPPGRTALVTHSFSSAVLDALTAAGKVLGPDGAGLAVTVCEARPLCEGARLAAALAAALPAASLTLITDAQAAWHVRTAAAAVVVGADAVLTGGGGGGGGGGVVNKVGTWALAAAAAAAGVPAFAIAGGAKLTAVPSLPALAAGCLAGGGHSPVVPDEEPDPAAELTPGLAAAGVPPVPASVALRNVYFETTPLSLFTHHGGGVVVEGAVLTTPAAVEDAGAGAVERAADAFCLDWLA